MTPLIPVPADEQHGLAEEWTEREPVPPPEEPPTLDLRPNRAAAPVHH